MPLQHLLLILLNLKEKFHHQLTTAEITLLKHTQLFDKLSAKNFQKLLHSIETVHFADDAEPTQHQAPEDFLYVVKQGVVRLFIYDRLDQKAILASYTRGQYFGAASLIGKFNPTHPIFFETIGDTVLIKVNAEFIALAIGADFQVKNKLMQSVYQQAINILSCALGFYGGMKSLIENAQKQGHIFELKAGEVLFTEGERPDFVYFIIDGEIELQLRGKNSNHSKSIILHEGYLFGELSIITGKLRASSAIMRDQTHLLAIPATLFKQEFMQSPLLQRITEKLQQTYRLPTQGLVEQFVGNIPDMGTTLTSLSKIADDRFVLSEMSLDRDLFNFAITNLTGEKTYKYQKNSENVRELYVLNDRIVGIKVQGTWDNLADICQLLLKEVIITETALNDFQITGEINIHQGG